MPETTTQILWTKKEAYYLFRLNSRPPFTHKAFLAFLQFLVLLVAAGRCPQTVAMTNQVALFTGFGALPGAGMDVLNAGLSLAGIPDYLGRVFQWTEQQEAFDWIQQWESERSTLVIIGHSFGGNSALQLANDFLKPNQVDVDLTIQVDSVANFGSGWNDLLPTNVDVGFNYYQISTGFFEPQGEDVVQGATNFNTEVLFNDTSITHISIDSDPRLHALISQNIVDNLNQRTADFNDDGDVDGSDFILWQRGESPNPLSSTDLTTWEQAFGQTESLSASHVVPEPCSFALMLSALLGLAAVARRQDRHPPRTQSRKNRRPLGRRQKPPRDGAFCHGGGEAVCLGV